MIPNPDVAARYGRPEYFLRRLDRDTLSSLARSQPDPLEPTPISSSALNKLPYLLFSLLSLASQDTSAITVRHDLCERFAVRR